MSEGAPKGLPFYVSHGELGKLIKFIEHFRNIGNAFPPEKPNMKIAFEELVDISAAKRSQLKLSQAEMARFCKVSVRTITNWENKMHLPDQRALCELLSFLHYLGRIEAELKRRDDEPLAESPDDKV